MTVSSSILLDILLEQWFTSEVLEQQFIEIGVSIIEPEFTFFQVKVKG